MTFTVTWAHIHSIIGWIYAIMVWASFAHDFSIDLSGKHMPTKSYQKYGRDGRTDAFLWGGLFCKYCPAGSYGF